MIQVKDLQFPRYFLLHEIDLDPQIALKILQTEVEIRSGEPLLHEIDLDPQIALKILQTEVEIRSGEPDKAILKGNKLIITDPSSITKFIFLVLYKLISHYAKQGIQQDKLGLALLFACREYTYVDYVESHKKMSVLISEEKIAVCDVIINELIEPLVGKISRMRILYLNSNFVDACEIAESAEKFSKRFKLPFRSVSFHDYPILVTNNSIYNEAATMAHICIKILKHNLGTSKTHNVVKNLILSDAGNMGANLVSILKVLKGDPIFVMDFLKYFKSNVALTVEEEKRANHVRNYMFATDSYLSGYTKTADGKHTPEVFKQWHEWSAIVGLIEKQLAPMRGSMWPTSDNVKPHEDVHRQMEVERAKEKGKTQLNFEELLELTREWYGHKHVMPGELTEKLLSENRVWKT